MSRWSEWDSAYSLSLLFTLIPLCFCIFACVCVCLSGDLTPFYCFSCFISFLCFFLGIEKCTAWTSRKVSHHLLGMRIKRSKYSPSKGLTCNLGVLTPVCESMFDVAMNKLLQELSSSVTKVVQCYMTQRTVDNTLHLHSRTYTYILYIPSLTRCLSLLIVPVTWFSGVPFS